MAGRQVMILKEQLFKLLANGATNLAHRMDDGNTEDFWPVVKLFNPCGAATWLLSELDEDGDTAFGLCDLGQGTPEMGYVSLTELASIKLRFGLYIERDTSFEGKAPLTVYWQAARNKGRITEDSTALAEAAVEMAVHRARKAKEEHEHNFVDGECTGEDCYAEQAKAEKEFNEA